MLAKISGQTYNGQTKSMYFLTEDDDLLEKHNTIWNKVSADRKKEFDSKPVYNKNVLNMCIIKYFYDKNR